MGMASQSPAAIKSIGRHERDFDSVDGDSYGLEAFVIVGPLRLFAARILFQLDGSPLHVELVERVWDLLISPHGL
jgi:hypothetical protein